MPDIRYQLHPAQRDVYFDQLINIDSPHYNTGGYIKLIGHLDINTLGKVVDTVPTVFDAFRMRFNFRDPEGYFYLSPDIQKPDIREMDFSQHKDPVASAVVWTQNQFNIVFDFKKEHLLCELFLLKISETEHWFFNKYHHLITDGFGFVIWAKYISKKYAALVSGSTVEFNYPSYIEETVRASAYYSSNNYDDEGKYWQTKMESVPGRIFNSRYGTPDNGLKTCGKYSIVLDEETRLHFLNVEKETGCSLQQLTLAAVAIYLGKTYRKETLTIGVPIHKRRNRNHRNMVGMFSGTIPFVGHYSDDVTVYDLLKKIKQCQKEDYRYQNYLVSDLNRFFKNNSTTQNLFEIIINYEALNFSLDFGEGLSATITHLSSEFSTSPLHLCWRNFGTQQPLEIHVDFQLQFFSHDDIVLLVNRIMFIMSQFDNGLNNKASDLQTTPQEERNHIAKFSRAKLNFPKHKTVVDVFEEQVEKNADKVAVIFGGTRVTYRELDAKANKVAHFLHAKGLKKGDLVLISVNRSTELIIGILGILKAGGVFVPVDPLFPDERISFILKDTNARLFLADAELKRKSKKIRSRILLIDIVETWPEIEKQWNGQLYGERSGPKDLVYVIYTSGSTGTPKGVMIEHQSLMDHLYGFVQNANLKDCRSFALFSSLAVDAGHSIVFTSLITGAALHILPEAILFSSAEIDLYLRNHSIDCFKVVPSMWLSYLNENRCPIPNKVIMFGGEVLTPKIIYVLTQSSFQGEVYNHYGPTETTIGKCLHRVNLRQDYGNNIPIGSIYSNSEAVIVNEAMDVVPIGVEGELLIGGEGVARGYLNRIELTNEKFIKNPFGSASNSRLYKTGDLCRWTTNGNIEYVGRIDDQVKIRGNRIELGEIENTLLHYSGVQQAVLLTDADNHGNDYLVAYVVPKGQYDESGIVSYLKARLPEYMIPSIFIEIESVPLTPGGKVAKKALPKPTSIRSLSKGITPRNETERILAEIWQMAIGIEPIGPFDNFFSLGGHSLSAIKIASGIRKQFDVAVPIKDIFLKPTVESLSVHILSLSTQSRGPVIQKQSDLTCVPLSFSQERLWFTHLFEGSVQYHDAKLLNVKGPLNIQALEYALRRIIERHETLRTVIRETDGIPFQECLSSDAWSLTVTEVFTNKEEMRSYIDATVKATFDLSTDFCLRANLIPISSNEHGLLLTTHHIAIDGWSIPILINELVWFYNKKSKGANEVLPALDIQYRDYSIWQREFLSGNILEQKLLYWKKKLQDVEPFTIPYDFHRRDTITANCQILPFEISNTLAGELRRFNNQRGTTSFITLLSVFYTLLYRYTGTRDICVGTVVANRSLPSLEGLIGFFVNTIALRGDLSGLPTFLEFLKRTQSIALEAFDYQDLPFEKVVQAVVRERHLSKNPLFQIMFDWQATETPSYNLSGLVITDESIPPVQPKFDFTMSLKENGERISGVIEYNSVLYGHATISRLVDHFLKLLDEAISTPEKTIDELNFLSSVEINELLFEFNQSELRYPVNKTIIDLFEEQVKATPSAIAVTFENRHLTYADLNKLSNKLAHNLITRGVKSEDLIPLYVERGLQMIVGMVGILKAGAAYVPIDPDYPMDRINYMLEDAGSSVMVCSDSLRKLLFGRQKSEAIILDTQFDRLQSYSEENTLKTIVPSQLAYVIYTSGSTGRPKGVMIEHASLLNICITFRNFVSLTGADCVIQQSSISFDNIVEELYPALISGAQVMIIKDGSRDVYTIKDCIENGEATILSTTPLVVDFLNAQLSHTGRLRYLFSGGDVLLPSHIDRLFGRLAIVNGYGPSETTDVVSFHRIQSVADASIIGHSLPNVFCVVLHPSGSLLPLGMPGELHIGGVQLARGYLNNDSLTASKFIYHDSLSRRLYKTGDLCKFLPDGSIEYIGRIDNQIKLRGYRIELGEIENLMLGYKGIKQAVVTAKKSEAGLVKLVAYFTADHAVDKALVFDALKKMLPKYMIPGALLQIEKLPVTQSGKIDRQALPDPVFDVEYSIVPARNNIEKLLISIWEELLSLTDLGINQNFFELGGHSLLAARMVAAVRAQLNVTMSVKDIFLRPTIQELSNLLQQAERAAGMHPLVPQNRSGRIPLSFAQERLWFIDQLEGSTQYHMSTALHLKGYLETQALLTAIQTIVARHEALRTVFDEDHGQPYQRILDAATWQLNEIILEREEEIKLLDSKILPLLVTKPFDLSNDHPLRATLIRMKDSEHLLVITLHHISADGWSESIIIRELTALYSASINGQPHTLWPLKLQYSDYSIWQRSLLQTDIFHRKLDYWKEKLADISSLNLPTDYPRRISTNRPGALISFKIQKDLTDSLKLASLHHGCTLFMMLLAALKALLYRYAGQADICIGSPIANRDQHEVEGLVGFFVNMLVLRTNLDGNLTVGELIKRVKETSLDAFEHGEMPFEKIVETVVKERDLSKTPLFQVMFVLQNNVKANLTLPGLQVSSHPLTHGTSKFDFTFSIDETNDGLRLDIEYCTDLYHVESVRRMAGHYENLLRAFVEETLCSIGEIEMLSAPEIAEVTRSFNKTTADFSKEDTVIDLFRAQALRTPDQLAIRFEEKELTFRELDELSDKVCGFLRTQSIQSRSIVPICAERSLEMAIGILGILKAGAAFVPLDPDYPRERISYMLEDVASSVVLTTTYCQRLIPKGEQYTFFILQEIIKSKFRNISGANPRKEDLSYVIYTSGSTGKPKGVMIEHRHLSNFLQGVSDSLSFKPGSTLLSVTTYSFDIFYLELFLPLINGGTVVLVSREDSSDGYRLSEKIHSYRPTYLQATPTTWQMLLYCGWQNQYDTELLVGGEALSEELKEELAKRGVVWNLYGPTETTIWSTFKRLEVGNAVTVGIPLPNTRIYILSSQNQLCPVGIAGEICIGGESVARGYLNKCELTEERFTTLSIADGIQERIYRTGDTGRWINKGDIEYLGRVDDQLKIRGHRIETGEIENVLGELEIIQHAVVVPKTLQGDTKLICYYQPNEKLFRNFETEWQTRHVENWQELYDLEYSKTDTVSEEFNTGIWKNSFTGEHIPDVQMREWVDDIVAVILSGKTENVLEIGCGTGLIFYQLVGKVKKYLGVDVSRTSIDKLKNRHIQERANYTHAEFFVGAADELPLMAKDDFDTIIVNSVIQYFPGEAYLSNVIKKCISLLRPGGRLIIGDIRDYRLLKLFKSRLLLHKMPELIRSKDFMWEVDQEFLREEELCVSPDFFYKLRNEIEQINHVEIEWKQGTYINELTQYRYTAVIHVGMSKDALVPDWIHFNGGVKKVVLSQLVRGDTMIAIRDIPNPRLLKDMDLYYFIDGKSNKASKEFERDSEVNTILQAANTHGYVSRLMLSEDPLSINLVLEKGKRFNGFIRSPFNYSRQGAISNIPLFSEISSSLPNKFRTHLLSQLPEYMVPSDFISVQNLPLTNNGKIDRKFLREASLRATGSSRHFVAPTTDVEEMIAGIWQQYLGVAQIGVNENFFELGGHSLLATRVISAIRNATKTEISIRDLFLNPTIAELAVHVNQSGPSPIPELCLQARPPFIPLSFSQERLWFIDQLAGGSAHYNMPAVFRLSGTLNREALDFSMRTIVELHESLRTVILKNDGDPYQYIQSAEGWQMNVIDDADYGADHTKLHEKVNALVNKAFDLSLDFMLRADLIVCNTTENLLVVSMHHIASDGFSVPIFSEQLIEIYNAQVIGHAIQLPDVVQYADYAIWQREYLKGPVLDKKLEYWKNKLLDIQPLSLVTDYPRVATRGMNGQQERFSIEKNSLQALHGLANQNGTTLFMTLLAAFKVLLYRYTSQRDICVGTPVANRDHPGAGRSIGFFVNMVALRSEVQGNLSFNDLLKAIKETVVDALEHHDTPFEKIVESMVTARDLSIHPLFQVVFDLISLPAAFQKDSLSGIQVQSEYYASAFAKFDLALTIKVDSDGLLGSFEYSTELFSKSSIERMSRHYQQILTALLKDPDQEIDRVIYLRNEETHRLLTEFNDTDASYPKHLTLIDLFEQQVAKTPENVAVMFEDTTYTYRQINEQMNQLANFLIDTYNVERGDLISICLERSEKLIIGILAILKTGGAYVPIDPSYPKERIQYVIRNSASKLVLVDDDLEFLNEMPSLYQFSFFKDQQRVDNSRGKHFVARATPNDLAYIIYTSGTTGQPKGVMIDHQNVVRLIVNDRNLFSFSDRDIWTMFHASNFDFSVWEIFGALLTGGKLIVVSRENCVDTFAFWRLVKRERVTILNQTPSAFYNLIEVSLADSEKRSSLRYVIFGGESLKPQRLKEWHAGYSDVTLINMYGITETTVHVTYKEISRDEIDLGRSNIGKAIPTLKVYILDNNLMLVPPGVTGELYVSGDGLARGYLGNTALTDEKFITNPFELGKKMYKSGDLGKWLSNGDIEFAGRKDSQVKINGYRIELGEVEKAVLKCSHVQEAAVFSLKDKEDATFIAAYVVGKTLDIQELRSELAQRLPVFMHPAYLVKVNKMPLTSNGKIDQKSLPSPEKEIVLNHHSHVAPQSHIEKKLVEIWEQVLGRHSISIHENFFEIGGNSIKIVKMVEQVRNNCQVEFSVMAAFQYPNIAALARHINAIGATDTIDPNEEIKRSVDIMDETFNLLNRNEH